MAKLFQIQRQLPGGRWSRNGLDEAVYPETLPANERAVLVAAATTRLGRPARMVEIVLVLCDPVRKRLEPADQWWAAVAVAGTVPETEDDRLLRLIADPRQTGIECTRDEANALLVWAASLPGWASDDRPIRTESVFDSKRNKQRTKRWAGWSGYQIKIEDGMISP